MFSFLFKSATYYLIWKKFQKQILLVTISTVLIALLSSIYDDLFDVFKINSRENLIHLLYAKWILISLIIGFNIYRLKQVRVDTSDKEELLEQIEKPKKIYPQKSQNVLDKNEKLTTTTDLILKKYM